MEKRLMGTRHYIRARDGAVDAHDASSSGTLLRLLRSHPEKGLELLVAEYNGYVYSIVAGRLRGYPRQDIEECVSDVFYAVYCQRDNIDEHVRPLKAYICTVAKRKAIDRLRKLTSGKARINTPMQTNEAAPAVPAQDNQRLLEAIRSLRDIDAKIITLKYYFDMTNAEIGKQLGMKENTVSKRASRALGKLGEMLDKEDD